MAYILKNAQGEIIAASATENLGSDWILIEDDAKDYLDFLERSLARSDPFRESDIHLARVLEDLIDVLIKRGVIQFTDLPEPAQAKLMQRRQTRAQISQSLHLLPDSEPDDLI